MTKPVTGSQRWVADPLISAALWHHLGSIGHAEYVTHTGPLTPFPNVGWQPSFSSLIDRNLRGARDRVDCESSVRGSKLPTVRVRGDAPTGATDVSMSWPELLCEPPACVVIYCLCIINHSRLVLRKKKHRNKTKQRSKFVRVRFCGQKLASASRWRVFPPGNNTAVEFSLIRQREPRLRRCHYLSRERITSASRRLVKAAEGRTGVQHLGCVRNSEQPGSRTCQSGHLWLRPVAVATPNARATLRGARDRNPRARVIGRAATAKFVVSWRTYVTCLHTAGSQSERLSEGG